MFRNFIATAYMRTPIATIDNVILDSVILSAIMKERLGDEYYKGANQYGTKEEVDEVLSAVLSKQCGVYCTSAGMGDCREFIFSWAKRWDSKNDDIVKFEGRGMERIDIGSGHFKNYHMPLVLKSYNTITFYVQGDMKQIERLLCENIFYLGKKGSQGFGQIKGWDFAETDENYSLWKDGKVMRPIPYERYQDVIALYEHQFAVRRYPIIPPYWRQDNIELCIMP